jgi:hypothetical protein
MIGSQDKMSTAQTTKNLAEMLAVHLAVEPDATTDWNEFFQVRTCSRDARRRRRRPPVEPVAIKSDVSALCACIAPGLVQ